MATTKHNIRIYSPSNVLLNVFTSVRSARYRLAENEVGDFEVVVPWGNGRLPTLLSPPNHIEFWRDDTYVFGGYIRRQSITQDGRVPFYGVSGPSYMGWLSDQRMRSATGTADIVTSIDSLDDVIKSVVRTHVLDSNSKFVVASDSGLSSVIEEYTSVGYETTLDTLQNIAERAKDTTFDIVRDTDGMLRFRTYTPSRGPDKSKGTVSPTLFDLRGGNLENAEWTRDGTNVVNALWAGGAGNKAARYIWPVGEALTNAQSITDWGRIEGFIDAGSENTAQVQRKAQEELDKQSKPEESVNFKISQFGRYALGVDFDFGTKVTVVWQPVLEFTDVIRGIDVKLDSASGTSSVDINVGDTLTGDSATRAAIYLGRYLKVLRKHIALQTQH
jgi:hypothetical protein